MLIGKGNFGHVYRPPFPSANNDYENDNYVVKLTTVEGTMEIEQLLKQMDPSHERFMYGIEFKKDFVIPSKVLTNFKKAFGCAPRGGVIIPYGGQTLSSITELTFEQYRDISNTLVESIMFLHEHGLSHGDIRQDNVVIDNHGKVRLIDFDFAVQLGMNTPDQAKELRTSDQIAFCNMMISLADHVITDKPKLRRAFVNVYRQKINELKSN